MATGLPHYPPFDTAGAAVSQRWTKWLDRFERLLIIAKVTEPGEKRAWLLHYAGEKVNDIFDTIPATGNEDDYETAKVRLNNYFKPKVNAEYEIFKFRSCEQKYDESIDSYCTRLRELAATCTFHDVNRDIKTQIIAKCTSHKLRLKALSEELTLDQLLCAGRSQELSKKQADEIESTVKSENSVRRLQRRNKSKPAKTETCRNCRGNYPHQDKCPAKGVTCHQCGKSNHFARVCRSANQKDLKRKEEKGKPRAHKKPVHNLKYTNESEDENPGAGSANHRSSIRQLRQDDESEDEDAYAWTIHQVNTIRKPKVTVEIDRLTVKILIDTGASINLIDLKTFEKLTPRPILTKDENPVLPYAGPPLSILGTFRAKVRGNGQLVTCTIHVNDEGHGNLLGYETAIKLGYVQEIKGMEQMQSADDKYAKLCDEYSDRFVGMGKLKGVEVKLHIDESVRPVQNRHRRIPYHIREKVQMELEMLKEEDIIEEVVGTPTPWVSPIVAQPKPKAPDELRICVDMREPNKAIIRERHVTPTIDDLILELNGSSYFSKLDLNKGYHQIELAPESRYLTTFSANQKLWRYKRLMFGLRSAAEVFQNAIGTTFQDIPNVLNISDDILVHGSTQEEHDDSLQKVMATAREANLTFNRKKCSRVQQETPVVLWSHLGTRGSFSRPQEIRGHTKTSKLLKTQKKFDLFSE